MCDELAMTTILTIPDLESDGDGGAELRCDAAMYRRIVETANEGIWQTDTEFRATFVNSRIAEMLDYAPEEMLGRPIRDFMLPEEIADHERRSRKHRQGGRDRFERRLRHRDGHTVTLWVSVTSLRDEDGVFQGLLAMLTDITERKRAEQALAESESRYRHLFELESDAIFLIDNQTGQILEANPAAEALYGYSRAELLQRKNMDLSAEPEQTRKLTHEGRTIQEERGGKRVLVLVRWHRNREGAVFPVEITAQHFVWRGRAVHIAAIRDITERERMMADLRASEARFRSIFELSPLGIVLVSKIDQRILQANSRYCELVGYSLEELQRMTVADFTHPDDWPQLQQLYRFSSLEKPTAHTLRKRYLRKDAQCQLLFNISDNYFLTLAEWPPNSVTVSGAR
jgi:PAS domain S-box-containing protein